MLPAPSIATPQGEKNDASSGLSLSIEGAMGVANRPRASNRRHTVSAS